MSKFANFIAELRRRRVFRVAAFYAGIAFVIIQIIDGAFEYLRIPTWFGTAIIMLLLIGFPIAIILAWVFDITEEGIVRAKGRPADTKRKAVLIVGNKALTISASVAILVAILPPHFRGCILNLWPPSLAAHGIGFRLAPATAPANRPAAACPRRPRRLA